MDSFWTKLGAIIAAIVAAVAIVFKAGKDKGHREEQLDQADVEYDRAKEKANATLKEKLNYPAAVRVGSALDRARKRRALRQKRGRGGRG